MEKIKIIQNKEIAPGIYSLTFKRNYDFVAGQVVKITSSLNIAPRMYSIASSTNDANIQLIYDIKPEGTLTNILKDMKAGDDLFVSQPFGQFICNEDDAWWIATGTGIAPFYSMMKSGERNNVKLVHGVRKPEHFLFGDEFSESLKNNYYKCCSGIKEKNTYYGRVTDFLNHLENIPVNCKYYLCGSAEMVVDVRDILISKGVAYGNVFSEIYF